MKPVVLAVDDVSSVLRTIQYALQDNYKIYLLTKSKNALDFLQSKKPDIILLDYLMPEINGFTLIPMIRALPDHKETPIIIITSEGTSEHINEAMSLGASDFVTKPFNQSELNDKVAKHIKYAKEHHYEN